MALVASSVSSVWIKKKENVSASSTKVIDSIPFSSFRFSHYILRIENQTGDKAKSLNLEAQKVDNNLRSIIFGKFGNTLDVEVSVKEVGGAFQLEVVNNEAEVITFRIARLLLD